MTAPISFRPLNIHESDSPSSKKERLTDKWGDVERLRLVCDRYHTIYQSYCEI
ncbi:hypothetical protein Mapa_009699 [Marchantia paleacea]|nr:hypothetical protein Mapa_009699 [Marchantia paleacea]